MRSFAQTGSGQPQRKLSPKPKNDGWICVRRDATCVGSDDGTGADCALNDDGTSCEVLGGDCVFSAAVAGVDAEILKAAVVGVCAVWIGFMCVLPLLSEARLCGIFRLVYRCVRTCASY